MDPPAPVANREPLPVARDGRIAGPGLDGRARAGADLAPADLERLFTAFYTTKPKGLGLGLSICRSIVEAHGGRLWASANAPRGAVFQFALPHHPLHA